MISRDYILRIIERFMQTLALILTKKNSGSYQEANDLIDSSLQSLIGLNHQLIQKLSVSDILSLVGASDDKASFSLKCVIIAKLLKEKTDILLLEHKGYPDSPREYEKALDLFLEAILLNKNSEITLTEYFDDVHELIAILGKSIPLHLQFKITKFYELAGKLDSA